MNIGEENRAATYRQNLIKREADCLKRLASLRGSSLAVKELFDRTKAVTKDNLNYGYDNKCSDNEQTN